MKKEISFQIDPAFVGRYPIGLAIQAGGIEVGHIKRIDDHEYVIVELNEQGEKILGKVGW